MLFAVWHIFVKQQVKKDLLMGSEKGIEILSLIN